MREKRNSNYFEVFVMLSRYACGAMREVNELLRCWNADFIFERLQRVHTIMQSADREQRTMIKQLSGEFITPIEREDILQLSQNINEVTGRAEAVIRSIYAYKIRKRCDAVMPYAAFLVKKTEAMGRMIEALAEFKKKPKRIEECMTAFLNLRDKEKEYDAALLNGLFEQGNDILLITKWNNVCSELNRCGENCKRVADTVEYIVMKNS